MTYPKGQRTPFCSELPTDCSFEMKDYAAGTTIHNDNPSVNYLIFCYSGHARITSTLFHDEILCAGEVIFVPRMSEYRGTALSNITLLVHKFNNTVCRAEKCILSYLYSHRSMDAKIYCCKLTVPNSMQAFMDTVSAYITDKMDDTELWELKHKELVWIFTRYYTTEELRPFFHPMTNERVPFKSLVLTHYRKAEFTDKLADMCGYGLHNFRRIFKKEFGVSPYQWLMMKRAENIRYKLSQTYIPFADIIDEFNFSSPQHFSNFCKRFLGDAPSNIRKRLSSKETEE